MKIPEIYNTGTIYYIKLKNQPYKLLLSITKKVPKYKSWSITNPALRKPSDNHPCRYIQTIRLAGPSLPRLVPWGTRRIQYLKIGTPSCHINLAVR